MNPDMDPALLSLFGSETRLLTMAVLANAYGPMTGYRVAVVADLPRTKVYAELREGVTSGALTKNDDGYRMVDADVRTLLRKRVRIRWSEDWDRERVGWGEQTQDRLKTILASIPTDPTFLRPKGWKPTLSARRMIREMTRPPSKNVLLRQRGLRTSAREDWDYIATAAKRDGVADLAADIRTRSKPSKSETADRVTDLRKE